MEKIKITNKKPPVAIPATKSFLETEVCFILIINWFITQTLKILL